MNFKLLTLIAVLLSVYVAVVTSENKQLEAVKTKPSKGECGGYTITRDGTTVLTPVEKCGDGSAFHYYDCDDGDKCVFRIEIWVYIVSAVLLCSCIIGCTLFCLCKK